MEIKEIKKLAEMARIDMTEEEMGGIAHDFDAILAYVGQVQEVSKLTESNSNKNQKADLSSEIKNVMREDVATENPGIHADKIIEEMPDKDGRYLKVRQIL
jgi:aspartyl/glutamyl-tRNA(Asn/Gln) amidotransferase C subunit